MTKKRKLNLKEQDQLQTLKEENKKLKRQISALRRQIERLDLDSDRHQHLREIYDIQHKELAELKKNENMLKKWRCFKCGQGTLKVVIFNRNDGAFYFRSCDKCDHRTDMQKYTDKVKGIKG